MREVTDSNFDNEVSSGLVLVDFWADWCGPCKIQYPILEEVDVALDGHIKIVKCIN